MNERMASFVAVRGCRIAVQRRARAICATRMSSTESNRESIENLRNLQSSILARRRRAKTQESGEKAETPSNVSASTDSQPVSGATRIPESRTQPAVAAGAPVSIDSPKPRAIPTASAKPTEKRPSDETKTVEKKLTNLTLTENRHEQRLQPLSNVSVKSRKPAQVVQKRTFVAEKRFDASSTPFASSAVQTKPWDESVLNQQMHGQLQLKRVDGSLPFRPGTKRNAETLRANPDTAFVQMPLLEEFEIAVPFSIAEESFLPRINLLDKLKLGEPQSQPASSVSDADIDNYGDILKSLNSQQRAAVTAVVDKACLVLAGPGSGKTRVLTHRAAYLCRRYNISPHRILAVTFTNKAAGEMKTRLNELLYSKSEGEKQPLQSDIVVGTFHSICVRILRAYGETIGISSDFQICDAADAKQVVVNLLRKAGGAEGGGNVSGEAAILSKQISRLKNHDAQEMTSSYSPHIYKRIAEFRGLYDAELRKMNHLDFDDLLLETRRLLQTSAESRRELQNRYQHVLVDEWQDTNVVQFEIVSILAANHGNLFVVGDDDQAIFKFRGADVRNLARFASNFPDRQEIRLERNYRSTGCIVEAAQSVIRMNKSRPGKKMHTSNAKGTPVVICNAYDDRHEAWYVVKSVKDMLRDERIQSFSDVAVLYRTNMQSRVIEEACIQASLPYRIVGGIRFYDRLEVKDVMSYVRLLVNPADDIALLRAINTPNRGIGAKTIEAVRKIAEERQTSLLGTLEQLFKKDEDGNVGEDDTLEIRKTSLKKLAEFYLLIANLRAVAKEIESGTEGGSAARLIDQVLKLTSYKAYLEKRTKTEDATGAFNKFEERWMNVVELQAAAARFPTTKEFMQSVSLLALSSDVDTGEGEQEQADAITLLTLHSGKGLEFGAVFMVGVDEGTLPMLRTSEDDEIEEERRLAFVGMTRAKEYLSISHRSRGLTHSRHGSFWRDYKPSRFLQDIPPNLLSNVRAYSNRKSADRRRSVTTSASATPPDLHIGDSVRCDTLGRGTVIDKKHTVTDPLVEVLFASGTRQYVRGASLQLLFSPTAGAR